MTSRPDGAPGRRDTIHAWNTRGENYRVSVSHSNQDALQPLIELVSPQPGDLLLDIGTGAGHTAVAFAPFVRTAFASDLVPGMLREVPTVARQKGAANVVPVLADSHALPFRDGVLDIITSRAAAHHFTDVKLAVREMARVCRPGGTVLVVDGCGQETPEARAFQDRVEWLRDDTHVSHWSREEWVSMFRANGLRVDHLLHVRRYQRDLVDYMDRTHTPPERRKQLYQHLESAPASVRREGLVGQDDGQWWYAASQVRILGRKV